MTDINKLIEEEANKCVKETPQTCSNFVEYGFKKGASFILHKNRWRKVEEELPEWEGEVFTLITKKNSEYGDIYNIFPIYSEKSILFMKDLADEWKPIDL